MTLWFVFIPCLIFLSFIASEWSTSNILRWTLSPSASERAAAWISPHTDAQIQTYISSQYQNVQVVKIVLFLFPRPAGELLSSQLQLQKRPERVVPCKAALKPLPSEADPAAAPLGRNAF